VRAFVVVGSVVSGTSVFFVPLVSGSFIDVHHGDADDTKDDGALFKPGQYLVICLLDLHSSDFL
jgi:hypothetical protein